MGFAIDVIAFHVHTLQINQEDVNLVSNFILIFVASTIDLLIKILKVVNAYNNDIGFENQTASLIKSSALGKTHLSDSFTSEFHFGYPGFPLELSFGLSFTIGDFSLTNAPQNADVLIQGLPFANDGFSLIGSPQNAGDLLQGLPFTSFSLIGGSPQGFQDFCRRFNS